MSRLSCGMSFIFYTIPPGLSATGVTQTNPKVLPWEEVEAGVRVR